MFKGPCRGKMCDFWARIKIKKLSEDELAARLQDFINGGHHDTSKDLNEVVNEFWKRVGVKDLKRLCDEEPDLCSKMIRVRELALS